MVGLVHELSERDVEAIRRLHQRWIDLERGGEWLALLDLCTDDVCFWTPGSEMLIGKDAAKGLLAAPGPRIREIQTAAIEIRGRGSVAYKTSQYTTRFVAPDDDAEQVVTGVHLWILHQLDEEGWRVAFVTWVQGSDGGLSCNP